MSSTRTGSARYPQHWGQHPAHHSTRQLLLNQRTNETDFHAVQPGVHGKGGARVPGWPHRGPTPHYRPKLPPLPLLPHLQLQTSTQAVIIKIGATQPPGLLLPSSPLLASSISAFWLVRSAHMAGSQRLPDSPSLDALVPLVTPSAGHLGRRGNFIIGWKMGAQGQTTPRRSDLHHLAAPASLKSRTEGAGTWSQDESFS